MQIRLITLAAFCGLSATGLVRADDDAQGAWSTVEVDDESSKMLGETLKKDANYAADVKTRVCVTKIESIRKQVVQGMNYHFMVQACDVEGSDKAGMCADGDKCDAPKDVVIKVWEKPGNDVQISSIGPKTADDDAMVNAGSQAILGASNGDGSDGTNSTAGTGTNDDGQGMTETESMGGSMESAPTTASGSSNNDYEANGDAESDDMSASQGEYTSADSVADDAAGSKGSTDSSASSGVLSVASVALACVAMVWQ